MIFLMIVVSFIISNIASVVILKHTRKRWLSMISALITNAAVLSAAWAFYQTSDEARIFGTDPNSRYILILFIPIITWINFLIISYIKNKKIK